MCRPALSTRWGATALFVLAALFVAGCGGSGGSSSSGESGAAPKPGGTLRISQGEEVITLDPLESTDHSSINVISQIAEPLFKLNAQGENEPWLATSVKKSKDQKVWTLQIRQGVQFSDGKPMTSADVLFTLEQARKSAYWSSLFGNVEKIEAPSPSVIVITNSKPAPELEVTLSQWSFGIVPKGWGGKTEQEYAQDPIGTGPFMLGPWHRGETLTLERNPNYWEQGRPYLDKVVFQSVNSPESRVAQLKGGQLDAIYDPPWSQIEAIDSTPGLTIGDFPLGFVEELVLNSNTPLFQNEKAREAVTLGIDREGLVSAALGGKGEAAGSWIPPAVPYSNQTIEPTARNLAKAKDLLREAEEEGVDPSFKLLNTAEDAYWESAAQIVQQNLDEVGFKVAIENVDIAAWGEATEAGEFDMATSQVYSSTPSPAELFGYFVATEGLHTGTDVTALTHLYEQATSEVDPQKREALWFKMQETVAQENRLLPLTYSPYSWALKEDVGGFVVSLTGIPWLGDTGFTN